MSSRGRPSGCLCVPTSYEDSSQIGSGPMLMASFYLNHPCKGRITKHSHILREIHMSRLQHEFQRDTVQPVTAAVFSGRGLQPRTVTITPATQPQFRLLTSHQPSWPSSHLLSLIIVPSNPARILMSPQESHPLRTKLSTVEKGLPVSLRLQTLK